MNSAQLLTIIKTQLDELSIINQQFLENNLEISVLDKELLKQKCVDMYHSILSIDVKNNISVESKIENDVEVKLPTENIVIVEKVEPIIEQHEESAPMSMEEFETKELNLLSNMPEEVVIPEMKKLIVEEEKTETVEPQFITDSPIVKNNPLIHIPHTEISLHEKISSAKQPDFNERFNEARVESLKSAINLNKKIAFVNELFKENTVEYAKAIDQLNSSSDINEAMRYFNELKHQYGWSNENELITELEQLIQKRFR
jgi:hypothetical protein